MIIQILINKKKKKKQKLDRKLKTETNKIE